MPPTLTVLDESKHRRHGILSVGGIVLELADLDEIENHWRKVRLEAGVDDGVHLKYSMSWPDGPDQRQGLIEAIGRLPLKAVIALLEDFRPASMKEKRETRRDIYVQRHAFDWTLQRLAGTLLIPGDSGPHLVMVDGRDDFREFQQVYAKAHAQGWPHLRHRRIPPLRRRGFSGSLSTCSNGAMHEISDLVTSCVTRWADQRCCAHKGGGPRDLKELDACVGSLVHLFPVGGFPARRCGYSFIVHAGRRTGKELLHDHLDRWANKAARGH